MKNLFLYVFLLLFLSNALTAQTVRKWTGTTSTEWNEASNWDTGIPQTGDFVEILVNATITGTAPNNPGRIKIGGGNRTVTLDLDITIDGTGSGQHGLLVGNKTTLNLGTAGSNRTFNITVDNNKNGIVYNAANDATDGAELIIANSTIVNIGVSDIGINAQSDNDISSITNNGTINITGSDNRGMIQGGGIFNNAGALNITTTAAAIGLKYQSGADGFTNTGTITVTKPTSDCIEVSEMGFSNSGTINCTVEDASTSSGDNCIAVVAGGKLVNEAAGIINADGGTGTKPRAILVQGGEIENAGRINTENGDPAQAIRVEGAFYNLDCGFINMIGGRMNVNTGGVFRNNGLIKSTYTAVGIFNQTGIAVNNAFFNYSNSNNFAGGTNGGTDNGLNVKSSPISINLCSDIGIDTSYNWYSDVENTTQIGSNDNNGTFTYTGTATGSVTLYSCFGDEFSLTLTIATSTVAENICPDGSVIVNGVTYDKDKLTGTETVDGGAANGCDSVITVNLTLLEVATSTVAESICPDGSVVVNGVTYNKDKLTGTETVDGGAANGCDSIITVNLTLLEVATSTVAESICPDESVTVNGVTYDKDKLTGTETVDGGAANGCDSIITVNLTLLEVATSTVAENICPDGSVIVNGVTYDKDKLTGTETVDGGAANGCDSIITVNLTLLEVATSIVAENICSDESVVVNGVTYDKDKLTGTETVNGGAANGCDSIITVNLTLLELATSTVAENICPDESVVVNGVTYDKDKLTGTETVIGGAANGCDSVITVNLTLLEVATSTVAQSICPDESVTVNGVTYDKDKLTGTETVTGGAANGCDSIITVNLTLLEVATSTVAENICPDGSVVVNGVTYDKDKLTGTETVTGGAANGCDSVITVNLTLLEVATSTIAQSICPDESVTVNGVTYDKDKLTGTETVDGGAANGCDSIITVNLTLLEVATSTVAESICPDESVTVNGVTYDKDKLTGTETVDGGAANGCDSIITVNLTLLEVATSTVAENICPDGSVIVNGGYPSKVGQH